MKGPRGLSLAQASGWLFADLLLMLVIVVLGGQASDAGEEPPCPGCASSSASSSSAPSSSAASSSPASSTPPASSAGTASTAPPGLDPHSESITVRDVDVAGVLAHEPRALAHVEREVRRQARKFAGRHAALVLVWGAAASCPACHDVDLSLSQRLADEIAPRVRSYDPAFFPEEDPAEDDPKLIRPDHDGGGARNTVRLELFFVRT
jgi:hypothetical protein